MLILPINSIVESDIIENKQINNKKYYFEKRINDKLTFLFDKIKIKNSEIYNEIKEKINVIDRNSDNELCDLLYNITIICWAFSVVTLGIAGIVCVPILALCYFLATSLDCEWIHNWPPDIPQGKCKPCMLNE